MVSARCEVFEDKLSFPLTFLIFAFPAVVIPASVKIGGLDPIFLSRYLWATNNAALGNRAARNPSGR
jgi:hypothetical protein